jgi:hypothetical protein
MTDLLIGFTVSPERDYVMPFDALVLLSLIIDDDSSVASENPTAGSLDCVASLDMNFPISCSRILVYSERKARTARASFS